MMTFFKRRRKRGPRALDFIAKHDIKPEVAQYKLDDINEMIDLMQTGKSKSRMAVVF